METMILTSMLDTLTRWDTSATLAINGVHCGYLDNFMMMYSGRFVWIPLYVILLVVMLRNFHPKTVLFSLLFTALLITLCDQTASSILRPIFCRLRPANLDNPISPFVHVVDGYRGGRFGFPSSHSANCWGAFFFFTYVFRRRILSYMLMAWAVLMCWSRVYLGVHYVGDICFGMMVGLFQASLTYYIFLNMLRKHAQSLKPQASDCKLYTPAVVCGLETLAMLVLALFTRFSF